MDKPSLQEIADMAFPQSERALFRHYGIRPKRDNEVLENYTVEIRYSWREFGTMEIEVEAASEDEAERLALDMFDDRCPEPDAEIDDVSVFADQDS